MRPQKYVEPTLHVKPTRTKVEEVSVNGSKAIPFGTDKLLCRVLGSLKMFVDTKDEGIAPHLALDGHWESWITAAVMDYVQGGMRVVNVGANYGYYSLLMGKLVGQDGKVYSFECNPSLAKLCRSNVRVNGLSGVVEFHEKAAGHERLPIQFHVDDSMSGGGTIMGNPDLWQKYEVEQVTLDDVIKDPVDFMLIDVEGAEMRVLRGAERLITESNRLSMMVEWNPGDPTYSPQDLMQWANDHRMHISHVNYNGSVVTRLYSEEHLSRVPSADMLWLSREPIAQSASIRSLVAKGSAEP